MSSETPQRHLTARQVAQDFGYTSVESMAQPGVIPHRGQVLGVGATVAALGKEIASYRSEIHWTNVAPEYTDPDIVNGYANSRYNTEFETWDFESIDDILPGETFDRIYCHGNDINDISPESQRALGKALVNLLGDGGLIRIVRSNENFIENATHQRTTGELVYGKPSVVTDINPHLTQVSEESPTSTVQRFRRYVIPVPDRVTTRLLDKVSEVAAGAIITGLYAASELYEFTQRKNKRVV